MITENVNLKLQNIVENSGKIVNNMKNMSENDIELLLSDIVNAINDVSISVIENADELWNENNK